MWFLFMCYGFSLACFLNFFVMQTRIKTSSEANKRVEERRARQKAEAEGKPVPPRRARKVVLLHPDLGYGGAERLMIDAAVALQTNQKDGPFTVLMVTTHHEPGRAFKETTDGTLQVVVRGDWLPSAIFGRMKVLCATARMIYAALATCWTQPDTDCFVVDQVAAVMYTLHMFAPFTPILFYCHFPDQRCDPNRNDDGSFKTDAVAAAALPAHKAYRSMFDSIEERSMTAASSVVCNSRFSRSVTVSTFPQLADRVSEETDIFYPPVPMVSDAALHAAPVGATATQLAEQMAGHVVFVSINRYERKKNIALAVEAFAKLLKDEGAGVDKWSGSPMLVISGGYDTRLQENVSYEEELRTLAKTTLGLPEDRVLFLRNITDAQKRVLLSHMRALLYTPANEHFGIVPVEAMMYAKPVIAVNHGGPCESVGDVDKEPEAGGLLCNPDADAFAAAMRRFGESDAFAAEVGAKARARAIQRFSIDTFSDQISARVKALCEAEEEKLQRAQEEDDRKAGRKSPELPGSSAPASAPPAAEKTAEAKKKE